MTKNKYLKWENSKRCKQQLSSLHLKLSLHFRCDAEYNELACLRLRLWLTPGPAKLRHLCPVWDITSQKASWWTSPWLIHRLKEGFDSIVLFGFRRIRHTWIKPMWQSLLLVLAAFLEVKNGLGSKRRVSDDNWQFYLYRIRESKQPPGCISSRQTQFQCLAVKLYFFALGLPMTISVCKWAADVSWPMNNWGQFANVKLISVCQWSADISLPMSCWCYVGQWAAGISWPINSWCKLANM